MLKEILEGIVESTIKVNESDSKECKDMKKQMIDFYNEYKKSPKDIDDVKEEILDLIDNDFVICMDLKATDIENNLKKYGVDYYYSVVDGIEIALEELPKLEGEKFFKKFEEMLKKVDII